MAPTTCSIGSASLPRDLGSGALSHQGYLPPSRSSRRPVWESSLISLLRIGPTSRRPVSRMGRRTSHPVIHTPRVYSRSRVAANIISWLNRVQVGWGHEAHYEITGTIPAIPAHSSTAPQGITLGASNRTQFTFRRETTVHTKPVTWVCDLEPVNTE